MVKFEKLEGKALRDEYQCAAHRVMELEADANKTDLEALELSVLYQMQDKLIEAIQWRDTLANLIVEELDGLCMRSW